MSNSVQPISSSAMSALLWELENGNAEALYGASPFGLAEGDSSPPIMVGRLARVLAFMRDRVVPSVMRSLNTSQITVIRRNKVSISDDPLGVRWVEAAQTIYAVISGPTAESLERGLLDISDYEVLIPANTLGTSLTDKDALQIGGVYHDVVAIQGYPKVPAPVAYKYCCKRAA